jgi:signal transduction histidine kinase/DNA-binding response OmpR family regulator
MDATMELGRATGSPARPWWLLALAAGLTLGVLARALPAHGLPAGVAYLGCVVLATVSVAIGGRVNRLPPAIRRLVTASWAFSALGSSWWVFYPHVTGRTVPFPSPADAGYLLTDLTLLVVLVLVGQHGRKGGTRGATIDAVIAAVAIATVSWAFLIEPLLAAEATTLQERLISVSYAAIDLLLVGTLLRLWFLRGIQRPAHIMLAAGFLLHVLGNESYAVSLLSDDLVVGTWYDPLYLVSWSLIAGGALHPSMRLLVSSETRRADSLTRGRLAFLAAAMVLPSAVIIGELMLVGRLAESSRVGLVFVTVVMSLLVLERMRGLLVDLGQQREMQRLKNEFTSVVSHELRTPLTSIRGSLGLMAGGALGAIPPQAQRMLDIAVTNTDRLIRLINDILDLERIESGEVAMDVRPVDARAVIDEAIRTLEGMACEAGVRLEAGGSPITVSGDRDRLIQALTNLLGNAIKFSPSGASVRAIVERTGEQATFRVEDEGRGIPADRLEEIFQAFEQVDASDSREHGGTGLGLAISRMIVQRHGGRIWAKSTVGRGSTFSFTVPALAEVALGQADDGEGPTVLLCDDDDDVREVRAAMLAAGGYRVLQAGSGEEAVRLAVSERPRAVLLDLQMPGVSGWETVGALRDRPETRAIPIVIVSVMAPEPDEAVDVWLPKPVDERSLFASLEAALEQDGTGCRVLLVEDDDDLAAVIVARLSARGVETVRCATAAAALAAAAEIEPDLLVLDLGLPDGDGFEVVEALRRDDTLRSVPTVVYTGRDVSAADRKRLALGDTAFLEKGRISVEDFEARVLELLGRLAHGTAGGAAESVL